MDTQLAIQAAEPPINRSASLTRFLLGCRVLVGPLVIIFKDLA